MLYLRGAISIQLTKYTHKLILNTSIWCLEVKIGHEADFNKYTFVVCLSIVCYDFMDIRESSKDKCNIFKWMVKIGIDYTTDSIVRLQEVHKFMIAHSIYCI